MIAYAGHMCECTDEGVMYIGTTAYVKASGTSTTSACDCSHEPVEEVVYIYDPPPQEPDPLDEEGLQEPPPSEIELNSDDSYYQRGPPGYVSLFLTLSLYAPLLARPPPGRLFFWRSKMPHLGEIYEKTGTLCQCEILAADVKHVNTGETMVVFRWTQHPDDPTEVGKVYAMSQRIFGDIIDVDGQLVPQHQPVA